MWMSFPILVGHKIEAWKGWPGKVDKFFFLSQEFQLLYCDPKNRHKRAKKLMFSTYFLCDHFASTNSGRVVPLAA